MAIPRVCSNPDRRNPRAKPMRWLTAHVNYSAPQCLIWPFQTLENGYGIVKYRGARAGAHRIMCLLAHGEPLTGGLHAAHSCGNRACVNPAHLRWATPVENERDKITHNRVARGGRIGTSKLTEGDVRTIRSMLHHSTQRAVAERFSVSVDTIHKINNGRLWAWLP
jgi:hypothetical protein